MSHVKTDKLSARTASGTITVGETSETIALGSGASIDSGFTPAAISVNASASSGALAIDASDNLQFDSGFGSTATAYGCRAWANFNSSGTLTINESKNVSSITDNGAGNFDFNFSSSMPDTNYAVSGATNEPAGAPRIVCVTSLATSTFRIYLEDLASNRADADVICITVVR